MPSTLVLNADQNACPALGTWISNNTTILSGFSLLIAEDIAQQIGAQENLEELSITPCRSIRKGGDIAMAAKILQGEISGLIHFPPTATGSSTSAETSGNGRRRRMRSLKVNRNDV